MHAVACLSFLRSRLTLRYTPGERTLLLNTCAAVQVQPNYFICVRLVTTAALKEMRLPGLLTVAMPVTVGLFFRWIGELQGKPLLGYVVLTPRVDTTVD